MLRCAQEGIASCFNRGFGRACAFYVLYSHSSGLSMHITLAAIGKSRSGTPAAQLFEEYRKRLPWTLTVKEMEEKKPLPTAQRMAREAELLLSACEGVDRIIALDERGKALSSPELAQQIGDWQQEGYSKVAFLIGGQDGLDRSSTTQSSASSRRGSVQIRQVSLVSTLPQSPQVRTLCAVRVSTSISGCISRSG